jgi:hypothetical protein
MIGDGDSEEIGGMKIGRGNQSTRRKPTPSATLSTTNPTWLDPVLNPGRRGGKPATLGGGFTCLWGYWHCGHSWPILPASGDSEDDCGEIGRMETWKGNRSTGRKPTPSATLSTTNLTWQDPGLNPDLHGVKPATNRLSYGASLTYSIVPQPTTLPRKRLIQNHEFRLESCNSR